MRFFLPALFILLFSACGSATTDGQGKDERQSCPLALMPTQHTVRVRSQAAIPNRLTVMLNGVLKYDECKTRPGDFPPAPQVTIHRDAASLDVTIVHLNAYEELPTNVSFELVERVDCQGDGQSFFSATNVPLEFVTRYPHGPNCGASVTALTEVSR